MLWKVQASALPRSPRAGVPAGPGLSAHQALPLTDVGGPAPDTTEPVTLVGGRCGGVGSLEYAVVCVLKQQCPSCFGNMDEGDSGLPRMLGMVS